ncbi:branched-chain amino acid ABC transporter permease [Modestobacter lapidis]|nr:branched-chain amino acid ABC transporter permease [Modestobacter lapidis]
MLLFYQVLDGLVSGSIYAALALAIVLAYRATGVINFAQGQMAVFSAYLAWSLTTIGLPVWLAIAGALLLSVVVGAFLERVVMRRFESAEPLVGIVVSIGLFISVNGLVSLIWGTSLTQFPAVFPAGSIELGDVGITYVALGTVVVLLLVIAALQLLFMRTRLGLGFRAVAVNPESSSLSGLPVGLLLMTGWGLAAALGALAGTLVAPALYLQPGMMDMVLIYALAAAVLGGLDSPFGAVVAAWLIGVVENLAGTFIPAIGNDLKIAVPLVLMCLVLFFRPQGLFGRVEVERV